MPTHDRAHRSGSPAAFRLPVQFLIPFLALVAPPAMAVDGVLEINQACAVHTGCFTGDTAGFPVTITSPGLSVRLTSSLSVPSASVTAISVGAADVTVDLNGFQILGPTVCSGVPLACAPTGSGRGIFGGTEGTAVSNGTIRGMGGGGVALGQNARVSGVQAVSNGGTGISTNPRSLVTGCVVTRNGANGILSDEGVVRENVSSGNGGFGVDSFRSTIIGNTIRDNEDFGLTGNGAATGYGHNNLGGNNGGGANPQVSGALELSPNVCGIDLVCP